MQKGEGDLGSSRHIFGLDLGGDDYITKPFRVKELLSRIKAALRRSPGGSVDKTHIISGGIQIYPLEAKVLKKGSPLQLTPGEYKLLNLLMSNGDLALSRAMILEKLWDVEGEFVDDNTLSVYIRRLREKIEDNPSKPEHILTVRGIGYKWVGGIQSHEKLFFQS